MYEVTELSTFGQLCCYPKLNALLLQFWLMNAVSSVAPASVSDKYFLVWVQEEIIIINFYHGP
jgi:hypothetical protein